MNDHDKKFFPVDETQPNNSSCVLVLDDFECVRTMLRKLLNHAGIPSLQTGSEDEAWKLLGYPEVRLLIQDFRRGPGSQGGLRFFERMRSCTLRRHIPVIVISGSGRQFISNAFSESFNMPVEELIILREKPFDFMDFRELIPTIHNLLTLLPWPAK